MEERLELTVALAKVNAWCSEGRPVKVVICDDVGTTESGWGGVICDGTHLRIVYQRDGEDTEIDTTFDVSGTEVFRSSIWKATAEQQQKFGHFDEGLTFALLDGRTLLLMCAPPKDQNTN